MILKSPKPKGQKTLASELPTKAVEVHPFFFPLARPSGKVSLLIYPLIVRI
jgi:hypothetical protein